MENNNKILKEIQTKRAKCIELNKLIENNKACINKLQYKLLKNFEWSLCDLKWNGERIVLSFKVDIISLDSGIKALYDERYIHNGAIRVESDRSLLTIWGSPSELFVILKDYNIKICDSDMLQIREIVASVLHMQDHDKRLRNIKYKNHKFENNPMSSKPAVIDLV